MKTINQRNVNQMFKSVMLIVILIVVSACSTENLTETDTLTDTLNERSNQATRPMKGKITNAPAEGFDPLICDTPIGPIPITTNDLFGNLTHIGKLQAGSYGIPLTCEVYDISTFTLRLTYILIYVAPNGDELYGESDILVTPDPQNFDNGSFTGGVVVTGGTGRFENASGSWDYDNGFYIGPNSSWEIDGEITY